MFLNSSIGISEGVRATLFLRDCRKRNIIHRGGVDIKWNGPRRTDSEECSKGRAIQNSTWKRRTHAHKTHASRARQMRASVLKKVGIRFYPPKPHRSRGTEIEFWTFWIFEPCDMLYQRKKPTMFWCIRLSGIRLSFEIAFSPTKGEYNEYNCILANIVDEVLKHVSDISWGYEHCWWFWWMLKSTSTKTTRPVQTAHMSSYL